jgi:hypothetical protein
MLIIMKGRSSDEGRSLSWTPTNANEMGSSKTQNNP